MKKVKFLMERQMRMKTSLHFESTLQTLRLYCVLPWLLLAIYRAQKLRRRERA
jgi:hypothetical protein